MYRRKVGVFEDRELWNEAQEQVRRFGLEAPIFAAMEADRMLEQGDVDGVHTWCMILRRTRLLLSRGGEPVH